MSTKSITIYSTPTCGFCHMLKQYLSSKGIAFKEHDITQDHDAMEWVYKNTGQLAVPVTDIEGEVIIGFDRPRIDAALAK